MKTLASLPGFLVLSVVFAASDGRAQDGTFSNVTASVAPNLPGVRSGCVAWGDYDRDGRLDFLLTGTTNGFASGSVSRSLRNTDGGFNNVNIGLNRPVYRSSVAWGDYNNDGRLDVLLTGVQDNGGDGVPLSALLTNVTIGNDVFYPRTLVPGLPNLYQGCVAWGDYDNDGRLDFLLTGFYYDGSDHAVSQLWRNTGNGFSNVTASVVPGLPGVHQSSAAWGDYDNDGRRDFLLMGNELSSEQVCQIWRNTGTVFSNVTANVAPGLPPLGEGSVAWGDYDNDGRLDFLVTGFSRTPVLTGSQVWRNTGSGFSNVTVSVAPGLPGVAKSSVAWGDYDHDGRLDFLLTGRTNYFGSGAVSQLWRNTGSGFSNVTANVADGLLGVEDSSVAWGDYDNDGRLDFLLTGRTNLFSPWAVSQVWRNNLPDSNAPPASPTGLSAAVSGATVTLNWNAPADDHTPTAGLNYNVRIGTTPGGREIVSGHALANGTRLVPQMGNAGPNTTAFYHLPAGLTYYWSVQAVDTSFAGSPFAAEQQVSTPPVLFQPVLLGNGHFQFAFTNQSSVLYEVLGTTNVSLPVTQWEVLGLPASLGGGHYQFTDVLAPGHAQRFYLLRAQ